VTGPVPRSGSACLYIANPCPESGRIREPFRIVPGVDNVSGRWMGNDGQVGLNYPG
jgi:hypothetical protein